MPLRLNRVTPSERSILDNLMQLYLHEMSRYAEEVIGDDGRYTYVELDSFIESADRDAFLILVKGKPAGFVLVKTLSSLSDEPHYAIKEFFVLEGYRELGIGEEIARQIFDANQGHWQVGVSRENEGADAFWHRVLYRYTAKNYRVTSVPGFDGPVFTFDSPGPQVIDNVEGASIPEEGKPQTI